jgi:hypothetical protein
VKELQINIVMDDGFKPLESEEVLSVEENDKILLQSLMFTGGQLISQMKSILSGYGGNRTNENLNRWLGKGVDCKTLKFGAKGWQKGKIRIRVSLEFCPDQPEVQETPASNEIAQPESPLDDLRQMINQETQQKNL